MNPWFFSRRHIKWRPKKGLHQKWKSFFLEFKTVKTKNLLQTSSSAQMQTRVKLLGGMQSIYRGGYPSIPCLEDVSLRFWHPCLEDVLGFENTFRSPWPRAFFYPWPRECLSLEGLSLALASDFFCALGLGHEPCILDSTSDKTLSPYEVCAE